MVVYDTHDLHPRLGIVAASAAAGAAIVGDSGLTGVVTPASKAVGLVVTKHDVGGAIDVLTITGAVVVMA